MAVTAGRAGGCPAVAAAAIPAAGRLPGVQAWGGPPTAAGGVAFGLPTPLSLVAGQWAGPARSRDTGGGRCQLRPPHVVSRRRVTAPIAAAPLPPPPPPPPSAGSSGASSASSSGNGGGGGGGGGGSGGSGSSSSSSSSSSATPSVDGGVATHPLVVGARSDDSLTRLRAILGLRLLPPVVGKNGGSNGNGDGGGDDVGAASAVTGEAEVTSAAVAEAVLKTVFTPLDRETDVHTRCTAAAAVGMVPSFPGAYELLVDLIGQDPSEEVRSAAIGALGYLGDPRAAPMLRRALLEDTHWSARQAAAVSLGMLRDSAAYELLAEGAATGEDGGGGGMARACIGALGELGDLRAVPAVVAALEGGTDGGGRRADGASADDASAFISKQVAAEALGGLPCAESAAALERVVDSNEHVNVVWAAELSLKRVRTALDAPPAADPPPTAG